MTPLDLPSALEECLFRMQRGETLDQVLVEYPEWVEDLRPLLEAAQYADTLRPAWRPSKEIQARSRAKFLNAAQGRTVKIPCREILNSRIPGLNWAAAHRFFPNRHDAFHAVDQPLASGKRLFPMAGDQLNP